MIDTWHRHSRNSCPIFTEVGADQVSHTEKSYVAHAIGVYTDLKEWGFDEEFARIRLFHSIYGTQLFQGCTPCGKALRDP
jgi:hypothetical protein